MTTLEIEREGAESILSKYLLELEEARNSQTRADALISARELLQLMNMIIEYEHKVHALVKAQKEK